MYDRSPTPDEVCEMTPLCDESFEMNVKTSDYNYSVRMIINYFWNLSIIIKYQDFDVEYPDISYSVNHEALT